MRALMLLLVALAVVLLTPTDLDAVVGLSAAEPGAVHDPLTPVTSLAALAAWALAAWVGVLVVLTWLQQIPGAAGRLCEAATRRLAPRAVRTALAVLAGTTLAAAPGVASAAAAGPAVSAHTVSDTVAVGPALRPLRASLDWPGAAPPLPAAVGPDAGAATGVTPAPGGAAEGSADGPADGARGGAEHVVVPGDTLWALAERRLGPGATDAQVAAAWPTWWSANREAVGEDPHLLLPGTRLLPPRN